MDGEITPMELEQTISTVDSGGSGDGQANDPLVVDIRNPNSYAREHIPGSVNIPLDALPQEVDRLADREHVVTVCPHGKASVRAARLVGSLGDFSGNVESLEGGLEAWSGPVESADSAVEEGSPDAPF